jgi:hypothetical protein
MEELVEILGLQIRVPGHLHRDDPSDGDPLGGTAGRTAPRQEEDRER